jgi:hypothetical protein
MNEKRSLIREIEGGAISELIREIKILICYTTFRSTQIIPNFMSCFQHYHLLLPALSIFSFLLLSLGSPSTTIYLSTYYSLAIIYFMSIYPYHMSCTTIIIIIIIIIYVFITFMSSFFLSIFYQ